MIYLDNASTTKVRREVIDEMLPFYNEQYGNPSSIYSFGQKAADAVSESRKIVADALNCKENELYFTSGGSESDN